MIEEGKHQQQRVDVLSVSGLLVENLLQLWLDSVGKVPGFVAWFSGIWLQVLVLLLVIHNIHQHGNPTGRK